MVAGPKEKAEGERCFLRQRVVGAAQRPFGIEQSRIGAESRSRDRIDQGGREPGLISCALGGDSFEPCKVEGTGEEKKIVVEFVGERRGSGTDARGKGRRGRRMSGRKAGVGGRR